MIRSIRAILFLAVCCVASSWAEAASRYVDIPLSGRNGYRVAQGKASFVESFGETERKDGVSMVVEVTNVPLPPGTELIVFVHESEVGRLKLNKQRNGRLVLDSNSMQSAPRVKPGSYVTLQLEDGTTIIW